MELVWDGEAAQERGIEKKRGRVLVEVDILVGDSTKAIGTFGWKVKIDFQELIRIMVKADHDRIQFNG
jgi:GDPmannose 4,6-dehydratase